MLFLSFKYLISCEVERKVVTGVSLELLVLGGFFCSAELIGVVNWVVVIFSAKLIGVENWVVVIFSAKLIGVVNWVDVIFSTKLIGVVNWDDELSAGLGLGLGLTTSSSDNGGETSELFLLE